MCKGGYYLEGGALTQNISGDMPVSICFFLVMVQDPLTFRYIFLDDELVNKELSECYVDYFVDVKQTVGAVVLL